MPSFPFPKKFGPKISFAGFPQRLSGLIWKPSAWGGALELSPRGKRTACRSWAKIFLLVIFFLFESEAFGAEVQWDAATRSIRIYLPGKEIRITLQVNNTIGRVNNAIIKLDAPPQIIAGRTMVPLRFIAEAFGAQVKWDGRIRQIRIDLEI